MLNNRHISQSLRRSLGYVGLFGITTITVVKIRSRYRDGVHGDDKFSEHTRTQHRKHIFSGMHEPFITTDKEQWKIFEKHFSQFSYLCPKDIQEAKQKHAMKTPVHLKSKSECPIELESTSTGKYTLVVGGPPALVPGAALVKSDNNLIYINDDRRIPISYGSAWHIEEDAGTEAPTSYRPSQFMTEQLKRAVFSYVSLESIEKTGLFPWRTLDWFGWIKRPDHWLTGMRVALAFQWFSIFDDRKTTLKKVASQCFANEKFFYNLNQELNGQLLLKGEGSVIVARTKEEITDLTTLKDDLAAEGRTVRILGKEEVLSRYKFLPVGLMYGEKIHDRVIVPHFMELLKEHIKDHGGKVINATLVAVYADSQHAGGIAEYKTHEGKVHFVPFHRLIMSLGSQPILRKGQPLFNVVAARGVSVLAHLYIPAGQTLPPVLVCGATNHATKLTETPVSIIGSDGKAYDLYFMRFTAGACITPNVSDETTPNYDASIAVGLISSVKKTFGDQCKIEPLYVFGCNRQVSRNGQIGWIEPLPNVHIQYGAGGGGLTRAPDFFAKP